MKKNVYIAVCFSCVAGLFAVAQEETVDQAKVPSVTSEKPMSFWMEKSWNTLKGFWRRLRPRLCRN